MKQILIKKEDLLIFKDDIQIDIKDNKVTANIDLEAHVLTELPKDMGWRVSKFLPMETIKSLLK